MRDILITVIILGLIPFILRKPRLGAYVWAWLAMMIPHRLAFGFAQSLPFSYMVALATMAGFVFSRDRHSIPLSPLTATYLLFLVWMTVTSFFAMDSAAAIFERWVFVLKIHFFLFLTIMLIRGRQQIEQLLWVITLSLGFYGLKGGIYTLVSGGSGRVWGPAGGVIAGNNALGVALVIVLPFMYYQFQTSARRYVRYGMAVLMVTTFLAILGTQSRGALLSVVGVSFFLAIKSKKPVLMTVIIAVVVGMGVLLMPEAWTSRMNTMESYDQDASAMSRLYTWKTLWALALDRPLVGAGFNADIPIVFATYAPQDMMGKFDFTGTILVAHSIYFQALGEHGFPGLLLYILIGILAWRKASQVAAKSGHDPEFAGWAPLLMRMSQTSLAGFAVGAAFLSMVHFDLPYYIVGFVVLVDATINEKRKSAGTIAVQEPVPRPTS